MVSQLLVSRGAHEPRRSALTLSCARAVPAKLNKMAIDAIVFIAPSPRVAGYSEFAAIIGLGHQRWRAWQHGGNTPMKDHPARHRGLTCPGNESLDKYSLGN